MKRSMKSLKTPLAIAIAGLCLSAATPSIAADSDSAITIYSTARPGGISAEFYRPMPGQGVPNAMSVPGYALVRDDRELKINQGRSQISFTEVAALIDPTTDSKPLLRWIKPKISDVRRIAGKAPMPRVRVARR